MSRASTEEKRRQWVNTAGPTESVDMGRSSGDATGEASSQCGDGDSQAPLPRSRDSSTLPAPPDGGWGWVVVFASFMIHIVTDGVTYSFGMFFAEFLDYFKSGAGETALIASILVGVTLCSGPISSAFVNRYGCRAVTIAGAILGAVSLSFSVFAPNIITLYFTIGIGTGLGFGLIYLPAIVSVTCYFEKYRSLATGIAVCGSGLGTFIFAPVTESLIEHLQWRYALLVIALLVLACVIFGILFRPLKAEPEGETALAIESPSKAEALEEGAAAEAPPTPTTAAANPAGGLSDEKLVDVMNASHCISWSTINTKSGSEYDLGGGGAPPPSYREATVTSGGVAAPTHLQRPRSVFQLPATAGVGAARSAVGDKPATATSPSNVADVLSSRRPGSSAVKGPASRLALSQPTLPLSAAVLSGGDSSRRPESHLDELQPCAPRHYASGIMYRRDILYFGSLQHIHHHHKSTNALHESMHLLNYNDANQLEDDLPSLKDSIPRGRAASQRSLTSGSCKQGTPVQKGRNCCGLLGPESSDAFAEMMDCSLLRDPIFIIFTISNFLTSIGFNIPYVYLPVQAEYHHIEKNLCSWLLSSIGIANTIGRIVLGYISDKPWVNRLLIYNICLTTCGLATAFSALCESFQCFLTYSVTYGFFIGAYVGLTSVVLVDLMGLERLTNAFGLLLLFQGIASLIGPPIAGLLKDALDSYDPGFIVAGVTMTLSGVMLYIIPFVKRALEHQNQTSQRNLEIELNGTVQPITL